MDLPLGWSESKFRNFIRSALRAATLKWPPKNNVKKQARVERGVYICQGCKQKVPASIVVKGERKNNIYTDHIEPVVDPKKGFTTWDEFIKRLFVTEDKLQVLCKECHDVKTKEERYLSKGRRN